MLQPLMHPITDIAMLFAHVATPPGQGKVIYSVGVVRIGQDGSRTTYASHIRTTSTRASDYMHSRISKKVLASAPAFSEVAEQIQDFLAGIETIVVFDPYDALDEIRDLCGDVRIFDAGFAADYFMPWVVTASTRQLWEVVHGKGRDKVSFSALEGAELCVDFIKHLFGSVLSDTSFPAARALRFYLSASDTLFGDMCVHLLESYTQYFGGMITPVNAEPTADWKQFLEEAPKVERQDADAGAGSVADNERAVVVKQPVSFTAIPEHDIRQLFEQLAHVRKGYKVRSPQVAYAEHVAHALNSGSVACVEAGTGTGKTLGYLLPVMEFLKRNPAQRIAIATYTKSLQNQLYGNELSACRSLFGQYKEIPVALIKGKSNYVCARKLDDIITPVTRGAELITWVFFTNVCYRYRLADCDDITPRLRNWLSRGGYGGHSENLLVNMMLEVSAGSGCYSSHKECPAQVVTAEAANARLVITNHNKLVLMEKDSKLSGLFRHCIIDEANHFEDAVRKALSPEVVSADVFSQTKYLREQCRKLVDSPGTPPLVRDLVKKAIDTITKLVRTMTDLRDAFVHMNRSALGGAVAFTPAHKAFTDGFVGNDLAKVQKLLEQVHEQTAFFAGKEAKALPLPYKTVSRCRTMRTLVHEALFAVAQLSKGMEREGTWQAVQVFPRSFIMSGGNVYMGPIVRNQILARRETVLFTSATLTHGASFDPFRRSLGLGRGPHVFFDDEEVPPKPCFVTRVAPPFTPDYSLVVPSDAPSAMFEHKHVWLEYVASVLPKLIEANGGATLVLCASYEDLEALRQKLERTYDGEYPLLFQKKGEPPIAIAEEFRAAKESVLFGVETFWHGVDFPGDTLTQVIITRLPFPSPTSPVMEARKQFVPDAAYWERYRYETAIKFRQGIGRLIRREDDSGIVVVLDKRLLKHRKLSPVNVIEGMANLPEKHRRVFSNPSKK